MSRTAAEIMLQACQEDGLWPSQLPNAMYATAMGAAIAIAHQEEAAELATLPHYPQRARRESAEAESARRRQGFAVAGLQRRVSNLEHGKKG